jgi:hypothetical protein
VRAIAEALGGHCATLRRTEVGPFTVEEADPERIVPPDEALAGSGSPRGRPGSCRMKVVDAPASWRLGRERSHWARSTASTSATGGCSR